MFKAIFLYFLGTVVVCVKMRIKQFEKDRFFYHKYFCIWVEESNRSWVPIFILRNTCVILGIVHIFSSKGYCR